jgi:hypothetical protein
LIRDGWNRWKRWKHQIRRRSNAPSRRSLPRSDSAATLEVFEDRSGGAATLGQLDALDGPSETALVDGDDALFDGLDDIVDVRGRRPNVRSRARAPDPEISNFLQLPR